MRCKKCGQPVCDCTEGESCDVCLYGSGKCVDCEIEEAWQERAHVAPWQDAWYNRRQSEFHD